jgi:NDP-sugar pyrophosphorylase family protein
MIGELDAIIMAGGKGTRLLPYTAALPKPLVPLGGAPVLELILRQLQGHGFQRICLAVNHMHHLIQAYFGDGESMGLRIEYAVEDEPLGTCGPVSRVLDRMAGDFLLMNGDLVTDLDVAALRRQHVTRAAALTVLALRRASQLEFGVLEVDAEGRITRVREKPVTEHLMSMGVYLLKRETVRPFLEPGRAMDMSELLTAMISAGVAVDTYVATCNWLDIGTPGDYAQAQSFAVGGLDRLLPERR